MKKVVFIVCLAFMLFIPKAGVAKEISFVYINGANNNDKVMTDWFFDGVRKLHPQMKKAFEEDSFSKQKLLSNGKNTIKADPVTFFWGDMSKVVLEKLDQDLNVADMLSPKVAQTVRTAIAHFLHDAIWVSKYSNMYPIIAKLHEEVMDEYAKGNQVVLFGYSAGSFVNYEYMLTKSKMINLNNLPKEIATNDFTKALISKEIPDKTCADAIEKSKFAIVSNSGEIILNSNPDHIKKILPEIDKYTKTYCLPDDAVVGAVSFASPFALFYSEIGDKDSYVSASGQLLYQYLIENDKFYLTVNWANDPLGFPSSNNINQYDTLEMFAIPLAAQSGYVYGKSDVKSRSTFLFAHTAYWKNAKKFSKNVVQAYKDGYYHYYKPIENEGL